MKEKSSFHDFCVSRMVSLETENLFRDWFKSYIAEYFVYNDAVANQMMNHMGIDEIEYYWGRFIIYWKESMSEVT